MIRIQARGVLSLAWIYWYNKASFIYIFSIPEVIMSAIYTLGIDVGSTASKCIMLKDGEEIVAKS